MDSTTKKFTAAFDPSKEEHVRWLKKVGEAIKNVDPGKKKLDLEESCLLMETHFMKG